MLATFSFCERKRWFSVASMNPDCTSYYSAEKVLVYGFTCPKPKGNVHAAFCCGFNDIKYCCDDPKSLFPYEYGYMWWLRLVAA
ncbi:membrane protein FAM159A-like [Arapaima gigas]